ncbi:MAG: hypothetical protein ACOX18_07870 [Bacillota bacterium]|jgi:hypothetical protein
MLRSRLTLLSLLPVLLLVLVLAGCRQEPQALPVDTTRLHTYFAKYAGQLPEHGTIEVGVMPEDTGGWRVSNQVELPDASILSVVQTDAVFLPLSTQVDIAGGGQNAQVTTTYGEGKLIIQAETPQGPQELERELPAAYYDNEQIPASVAALDLAPGEEYPFVIVSTTSGLVINASFRLETDKSGKTVTEAISTPLGDFQCRKVILSVKLPGAPNQIFWISSETPFLTVKYFNGSVEYLLQELAVPNKAR